MNLSELTDKIYAEGVEKGNAEAQQIIAKAQAEAESIVAEAKKQAETVQAQAAAKAAELDKNTRAELRLFAEQSVNALKTEVANLLTDLDTHIVGSLLLVIAGICALTQTLNESIHVCSVYIHLNEILLQTLCLCQTDGVRQCVYVVLKVRLVRA